MLNTSPAAKLIESLWPVRENQLRNCSPFHDIVFARIRSKGLYSDLSSIMMCLNIFHSQIIYRENWFVGFRDFETSRLCGSVVFVCWSCNYRVSATELFAKRQFYSFFSEMSSVFTISPLFRLRLSRRSEQHRVHTAVDALSSQTKIFADNFFGLVSVAYCIQWIHLRLIPSSWWSTEHSGNIMRGKVTENWWKLKCCKRSV